MPPPSSLELAMQASVDEVLAGGSTGAQSVPAAPVAGDLGACPVPSVSAIPTATASKRGKDRRQTAAAERAAEEAARQAAAYDRELDNEAAAASIEVVSLKEANRAAEDDDEFDLSPVAVLTKTTPATTAQPLPAGSAPVPAPAVQVPTPAPAAPAEAAGLHALPAQGPAGLDAELEGQQRMAEELSAHADSRLATNAGRASDALRAVRAQASAGTDAMQVVVHESKSAAEKADELALSMRSGVLNQIGEDEDEDEEAVAEGGASDAGVEPRASAMVKAEAEGGAPGAAAAGGSTLQSTSPEEVETAQRRAREEAERTAAEAQWAAVEQASQREAERVASKAAAGGRLGAKLRGDKIMFAEAIAYFEEAGCVSTYGNDIVREDWSGATCLPRYLPLLRPKLKGNRLRAERDLLMCAAKVSLDDGDDTHDRMLMSIFKILTGNQRDPPRHGPHWDMIGFQGNDPATDLRGVGMLSLLNALYLVTREQVLARRLYLLSRSDRDFPFMTVSINITKVCLEALRYGSLTRPANERKSVVDAFHTLHCALYKHMGDQWQERGLSIQNFGHLLKELKTTGTAKALALINSFDAYKAEPEVTEDGEALSVVSAL